MHLPSSTSWDSGVRGGSQTHHTVRAQNRHSGAKKTQFPTRLRSIRERLRDTIQHVSMSKDHFRKPFSRIIRADYFVTLITLVGDGRFCDRFGYVRCGVPVWGPVTVRVFTKEPGHDGQQHFFWNHKGIRTSRDDERKHKRSKGSKVMETTRRK